MNGTLGIIIGGAELYMGNRGDERRSFSSFFLDGSSQKRAGLWRVPVG
jgi:hypothetical protein